MRQVEQARFIIYWAALTLQQGTNEAENTKEHYLLQEKSVAWRGVDTVAQHSYIKPTVHKHTTLLQLSDENPITPILMIFLFLPELEDYMTLYSSIKFHNPRKSVHNLKKTEKRKKMHGCQSGNEAVLCYFTAHFDILEMWCLQLSQNTRKHVHTHRRNRGRQQSIQTQLSPPYTRAVLNNSASFP